MIQDWQRHRRHQARHALISNHKPSRSKSSDPLQNQFNTPPNTPLSNWIKRSLAAGITGGTALFTFAVNVAWNVCAIIGASILIGAVFV